VATRTHFEEFISSKGSEWARFALNLENDLGTIGKAGENKKSRHLGTCSLIEKVSA